MPIPPRYDVFLSYSRGDQAAVELLARRLRDEAGLAPFFDKWHLIPGEPSQEALEEALRNSQAAAVFVGPSGISSWHNAQMRAALEEAVSSHDEYRVIPVLLPGARIETVSSFLARRIPVDFRPGPEDPKSFADLVAGITGIAPKEPGVTLPDTLAPYPGLQPFTVDRREFFFGRATEIAALKEQVRSAPFTAVVGKSGSGKSSLVLAGLLPELGDGWHPLVLTPGSRPLRGLADQLATLLPAEARLAQADDLEQRLAEREDGLSLAANTLLAGRPDIPTLLIVVDQFEEIFTQATGAAEARRQQQAQFIANLVAAVRGSAGRVRVVATLRADFIPHCLDFPDLRDLLQDNQLLLGDMGRDALREAIQKPAQAVGALLENGLTSRLLDDMQGQPAALPLLQFALAQLWQRRRGIWLTHKDYDDIGGVAGAINRLANEAYEKRLTAGQQRLTRDLLTRLVALGDEPGADTRRRVPRSALRPAYTSQADVDEVIGILSGSDLRLITADEDAVELAHDAVIEHWEQLRAWLREDRSALRTRQRLTDSTREWAAGQQDSSYLYREKLLTQAEAWAEDHGQEMTDLERAFLDASVALREREAAEREAQRRRELEQAQALAREQQQRAEEQAAAAVRLRRSAIAVAVVAVVAIAASIVAARGWIEANRQTREALRALAGQLAARAEADLESTPSHPQRSLLLGLEALRVSGQAGEPGALAVGQALRSALTIAGGRGLAGHQAFIKAAALSPDSRWLATGSGDKTARLWDLTAADPAARPIVLAGHENSVKALAISPDGHWLVTASDDKTARLWDLKAPDPAAISVTLTGHAGWLNAVAISPDSRWLVTASDDQTARLWDLRAADPNASSVVLAGHKNVVSAVAISPDNHWLVTASRDKTARLWDLTVQPPITRNILSGHGDLISAVAFSPDGRWLITGSHDGAARLWDMAAAEPALEAVLDDKAAGKIQTLAISPDGHWLATGKLGGAVYLWDLRSATPAARPLQLRGHRADILALAFSPDSHWLATGSADHTARLWNLTAADPATGVTVLAGHEGVVEAVAFSADRRWLVTAGGDGIARLWDLTAQNFTAQPTRLVGHTDAIIAVAVSPDSHWLATGSFDATARLWDLKASAAAVRPRVLSGHTGRIWMVAFSPDGHWLATGGEDKTVRLWDVAPGAPEPAILRCHNGTVVALAFSADNRWLVTAGTDSYACLWDLKTSGPGRPLAGHSGPIRAVAFSPDSHWLATGSDDGTAHLWDMTGAPAARTFTLSGHQGPVWAVAFSPDSRRLATGSSDMTARLWNVTAQDPTENPTVLRGHKGPVKNLAFSPDKRWLVTGSADNTARVWSLTADDPAAGAAILSGHKSIIYALAISADSHWLTTASEDGAARLWDLKAADPAADSISLNGHYNSVLAVALGSDGRWLVTGSADTTAGLWALREDELSQLACRVAGRNFTQAEWRDYFAGQAYLKTCPQWPTGR